MGCSGWDYRDWRGRLYPVELARRRWFGHYASVFDTVELNATFYRLPRPETVEGWAAQAPPGFVYSAKLGAFGTHRMKLRDAASWLPNHLDRARRLGPALGPTLVQLPPRWRPDPPRLDDFLAVAAAAAPPLGQEPLRWAVELRDRAWLSDTVLEVLGRHGAALCIHDLLADHPWELTTDWSYLRFHGPAALSHPYGGRYGGRRLWRVADRLGGWLDAGWDVYAYFNNDQEGHAPCDARWLAERLEAGHPAPRRGGPATERC